MARFDTDWNAGNSRRRVRRARLRLVVALLLVYALVVGGLYGVFRTRMLRVQAVNIEGATYTDPAVVRNALMAEHPWLFGRMAGFRNMLAWPSELSSSTRALIPSVQEMEIRKSYLSRTITVRIKEREPAGIWCFSRTEIPSCLWFDQNGVAYSPAFYTEGSLIPLVRDTAQDRAGENRRVLPDRLLTNFLAVLALIRDQHIPMREARIADLSKEEMEVATYGGPTMFFSLRVPPVYVVQALDELRAKENFAALQTVDFRSENRVFYK